MRRLMRLLTAVCLLVGCLFWLGTAQPVMAEGNTPRQNPIDAKLETEYGKKLDLNNANMRSFVDYRGLYPTLARKIIKNAPFDKVEDVMDMPGLSDREKEILQANLENFTVTEQSNSFTEGDDRINNGVYD